MIAMARAGGGNHYYGDTAEDLMDPFQQELELLGNLCLRDLRLSAAAADGVGVQMVNHLPAVDGGWRLKSLHRTIMLSRAYRASSAANSEALAVDPLNDAFWRFDMRRLTAEEIRDSIHVASGAFNPKMEGPGVTVDIPKEILAGQSQPGSGWGKVSEEEQARRSVYIKVKRSLLTPILADFDMADTDSACPVRFVTTQPTQALGMMNGEFLQKQAKVLAARVKREAGGRDANEVSAEIRRAYRVALVRDASDDEVTRGVALIDTLEDTDGVGPGRALELFCLMLLNTNEFAYLD
jgi:hypothetical protein